MPFYRHEGQIPPKRHIQFTNSRGDWYWEELVSREGFNAIYSNLYHCHPPTAVTAVGDFLPLSLETSPKEHRVRHLRSGSLAATGDAVTARVPLLFNADCIIAKAHVNKGMDYCYRNGQADEVLFIHEGSGQFLSNFGTIEFRSGDYLVIPRGVIWQINESGPLEILVIETNGPVATPSRYRNSAGQLMEHAPFCERDIRTPVLPDEPPVQGPVDVVVKIRNGHQTYSYANHPFDVVGWDGYYFPWAFNINDFEPITGRIHQPPPVHQTFQATGLVICSFVPRLYDYHHQAIPAPYAHSNVDSDEILYYVNGNFMSRAGMKPGSLTYHPMGLPHGPQPGKAQASVGQKETRELAVMIDTFQPLRCTRPADDIDDADYPFSWLTK